MTEQKDQNQDRSEESSQPETGRSDSTGSIPGMGTSSPGASSDSEKTSSEPAGPEVAGGSSPSANPARPQDSAAGSPESSPKQEAIKRQFAGQQGSPDPGGQQRPSQQQIRQPQQSGPPSGQQRMNPPASQPGPQPTAPLGSQSQVQPWQHQQAQQQQPQRGQQYRPQQQSSPQNQPPRMAGNSQQGPPPQQGQPGPVYGHQPNPGWQGQPQQQFQQQPQGPPPSAPAPKKIKRSPIPMIIGLIIMVIVGGGTLIALITGVIAGSGGSTDGGSFFAFGEKIAVLEVDGMLGAGEVYPADTERLRALVSKWTDDENIKGMVIRVNSPGGAVSATQDLYEEILNFSATGKPVYTSMGDVAASGGYYLAMASDEVWVNSGTLTGSIGVILSFYGYEELFDKLGLESRAIKSGKFKDIGSGTRPMTEEEKELLNEMVDDVFEQFFEVVQLNRFDAAKAALARKITEDQGLAKTVPLSSITDAEVEEYLRTYCDGRIFSGRQALDYGMADTEGTLQECIDAMRQNLGLPEGSPIVTTPKPQPGLFGVMDQKLEQLQQYQPGSVHLEFRFTM